MVREKINASVVIEADVLDFSYSSTEQALREIVEEDLAALFARPSRTRSGNEDFVLRATMREIRPLVGCFVEVQAVLLDQRTGAELFSTRHSSQARGVPCSISTPKYKETMTALKQALVTAFEQPALRARLGEKATATLRPPPRPAMPVSEARPEAIAAPAGQVDFGRYHALIIGNEVYPHLPRLKTPVADATAVAETLRSEYGFEDVAVLANATRTEMVRALDDLRRRLTERDNLLIYYAGHGYLDRDVDRGYWLPVDAEPDSTANWLSNADITDKLRGVRAKHVLVVADSCYSGTLVRDIAVKPLTAPDLARLAQKRARTVLTSGGLEPVSDVGGGEHSVFARAFLGVLRDAERVTDMTSLFGMIRRQVLLHAEQTPQYSDIRQAGHDGGDFLLVRRGATRTEPPN